MADQLDREARSQDHGQDIISRTVMRSLQLRRKTNAFRSKGATISGALVARREDELLWRLQILKVF
jgi:hypothetical protein